MACSKSAKVSVVGVGDLPLDWELMIGGSASNNFPSVAAMLVQACKRAGESPQAGSDQVHVISATMCMVLTVSMHFLGRCSSRRRASIMATLPGIIAHFLS